MKLAMIKIYNTFLAEKLDAHLLMTIHDEFLIEMKNEQKTISRCYEIVRDVMENNTKLIVPVIADLKVITDWSQMKDEKFVSLFPPKSLELIDLLTYIK